MKAYYSYIRVSTQKQGQHGVSLQEQRAAIERYAERHQLKILQCFEERETAAKRGRPIFTRMLKLLKQKKAAGIIIHKIDRGARNLRDWADLGELIDAGVEVHFATESLDLHTRGGRLSADIQAVVAADYIRNLREETRKGFYGRLKQGIYPLPAPIGYLDRGAGKPKEIDPAKGPLVRRAFELYATGSYNLHTLRDEMRAKGLRGKTGKPISLTGLSIMLNNPFYYGLIRVRKTNETFKGNHLPIICQRVFQQAQDVLRGKTYRRVHKHSFVFRRLLRCALCGYTLIGERQKGHVYYRCHTRGCPVTGVRDETVEQEIAGLFSASQLSQEEVEEIKAAVPTVLAKQMGRRDEMLSALEMQLASVKTRKDRLVDIYVDNLLEKTVFEERHRGLIEEELRLKEDANGLRSGKTHQQEIIDAILELAGSLYTAFISSDDEEKRALVKKVTSNQVLGPEKLKITLLSPFRELANRHGVPHSAPQLIEPRTIAELIISFADEYSKRGQESFELPLAAQN